MSGRKRSMKSYRFAVDGMDAEQHNDEQLERQRLLCTPETSCHSPGKLSQENANHKVQRDVHCVEPSGFQTADEIVESAISGEQHAVSLEQ